MSRRGPISNTDRELRTRHNRPPTCAFTPHARPRVAHRYQNYYNQGWTHLAAHQACCSHLLRDFTDAAQAYPDAVWPEQAQRALRGLIHAFNQARDSGQPEITPLVADPLISSFRHAVRAGLAQVPANPGPRSSTKQPPGRVLLEFCRDRETDVLLFVTDTRIWPTNNISERGLRPTKTQQKIVRHEASLFRMEVRDLRGLAVVAVG